MIEKVYANVNTIRADFVQVTHSAATGETRQKGKVAMKRPRMVKWDTSKEPNGSLFVSNGEKMYLYNPTAKQVYVYKDMSAAGPLNLIDGLAKLDETFNVELRSREGGADKRSFLVALSPKQAGTYKEIQVLVTRKKYELQTVSLTGTGANAIQIGSAGAPEDSLLVVLSMFVTLQDSAGEYESTLATMHDVLPGPVFDFLAPEGTDWDSPVVGGPLPMPGLPGPEVYNLRARRSGRRTLPRAPHRARGSADANERRTRTGRSRLRPKASPNPRASSSR